MGDRNFTAAVIGTGFSGICAAIKLKQKFGVKAQLFEMSEDVGGTWHANTYPGAECDIPSHLYSFSFELNPDWTRHYSGQAEIYAYLRGVARKYGIYEQTKLNTEVIHTEWMEDRQQWLLKWRRTDIPDAELESGYYDVVFAGLGPLRVPNFPELYKAFDGSVVHTARWDPTLDFTNKRVAVIGSGASAIQVIPQLRKLAAHLYSFQRTPAWVSPREQFTYPKLVKLIFRWFPFIMRLYRFLIYLQHELYYVNFGYYKSFLGKRVRKAFEKLIAWRLQRAGRPDLIPILTPDYPPGCKRIAKSELFLEALAKPNVTVYKTSIMDIKGRTLIDREGRETEVDILVLATGFHVQEYAGNMKIYGRNKQLLDKHWKSNFPKTYKTVTIHGYPNFFLLLGPSSGLGHNSVVVMIECQVDFAMDCIKKMRQNKLTAIEPKLSAQDSFVAKLRDDLKDTVWAGGCRSWYMNDAGEIYGLWSGTIASFWWALRNPRLSDFIQHKRPINVNI